METKQKTLKEKIKNAAILGGISLISLLPASAGAYLYTTLGSKPEGYARYRKIGSQISTIERENLDVDASNLRREYSSFLDNSEFMKNYETYRKRENLSSGLATIGGVLTIPSALLIGGYLKGRGKKEEAD
jgi:hypothetical protein